MDIYDVQNAQYALSVLDEIERQTNISQATRRVPIFLFNNHYISGDFILKQEGQTTFTGYSVLKKSPSNFKINEHVYTEEYENFQIVKTRRLIFENLNQFLTSYKLPDSNMEINFINKIVALVSKIDSPDMELIPQNDLLLGKNITFLDLDLKFDSYQFAEKDNFELISVNKEKISK